MNADEKDLKKAKPAGLAVELLVFFSDPFFSAFIRGEFLWSAAASRRFRWRERGRGGG
jgi:hypothetical protein